MRVVVSVIVGGEEESAGAAFDVFGVLLEGWLVGNEELPRMVICDAKKRSDEIDETAETAPKDMRVLGVG